MRVPSLILVALVFALPSTALADVSPEAAADVSQPSAAASEPADQPAEDHEERARLATRNRRIAGLGIPSFVIATTSFVILATDPGYPLFENALGFGIISSALSVALFGAWLRGRHGRTGDPVDADDPRLAVRRTNNRIILGWTGVVIGGALLMGGLASLSSGGLEELGATVAFGTVGGLIMLAGLGTAIAGHVRARQRRQRVSASVTVGLGSIGVVGSF